MNVEEAYSNLEQAVTEYIHSIHGNDKFVPHWIVVSGIHDMNNPLATTVHTVSEETTPSYVVNGLLNWATEQYTPAVYDLEFDDDDE